MVPRKDAGVIANRAERPVGGKVQRGRRVIVARLRVGIANAVGVAGEDLVFVGDAVIEAICQGPLQAIIRRLIEVVAGDERVGAGWQRIPYAGNRIPMARQSPLAKYLYSVTPAPTVAVPRPSFSRSSTRTRSSSAVEKRPAWPATPPLA